MPGPRILYINHDNPHPSGGVRTIYRHVRHLVRHGLQAFVVHGHVNFAPRWFADEVPTLYYQQGLRFNAEDIVIIPEDHRTALDVFKSVAARKIVFCQNHFYIFAGLGQHRSWHDLGIERVFASSAVIADFVRSSLGWQHVSVVPYAIDCAVFKPLPKKLQVAYMPRKRAPEAEFVVNFLARQGGTTAAVRWVPIDGVSEDTAAKILGESAIFLSMSCMEGFGLPPVEAMSAGCAVVGFHGYGGLEYATPANGFWCEEGNPLACAKMLQEVVEHVQSDSPKLKEVLAGGSATAASYSLEKQEAELLSFVNSILQPG